eukprot:TRINITY_DN3639_c0_g1_i7.p1 TRINITY_DN3639_c0_g1~~TRINITY_DN3639_c0_g1_i7.p1  ORF type:complete len:436 (+),score=58.40 TRINITY_DN3639_c0_g1_i7:19-1326(+)
MFQQGCVFGDVVKHFMHGCFKHFCGATLIASNLVLTAAHCLWTESDDIRHPDKDKGRVLKDLYVAIAPNCRHMRGIERIRVSRYFIPDDFQPGIPGSTKEGGDIAILMLETSVSSDVPRLEIAHRSDWNLNNIEGLPLTVLGWGDIWFGDNDLSLRHLRQATLKYLSPQECDKSLRKSSENRNTLDPKFEFCALNQASDTCRGDSGGPIIFEDPWGEPGNDVQIGISSWGLGQCGVFEKQEPGVYTNISEYSEWIEDIKALGMIREGFFNSSSDTVIKDQIQNLTANTDALRELKNTIIDSDQNELVEGLRKVLVDSDSTSPYTITIIKEQTVANAQSGSPSVFVNESSQSSEKVPQFVLPPAKSLNYDLLNPLSEGDCPTQSCIGNVLLCCTYYSPQVGETCSADTSPWFFGGYCSDGQKQYWVGLDVQCTCQL